jgi:hypothetical protein
LSNSSAERVSPGFNIGGMTNNLSKSEKGGR